MEEKGGLEKMGNQIRSINFGNVVDLNVNEDNMLITYNEEKIATISILDLWDMLKDSLRNIKVKDLDDPGLLRRKREAFAADMFTYIDLFDKGED